MLLGDQLFKPFGQWALSNPFTGKTSSKHLDFGLVETWFCEIHLSLHRELGRDPALASQAVKSWRKSRNQVVPCSREIAVPAAADLNGSQFPCSTRAQAMATQASTAESPATLPATAHDKHSTIAVMNVRQETIHGSVCRRSPQTGGPHTNDSALVRLHRHPRHPAS